MVSKLNELITKAQKGQIRKLIVAAAQDEPVLLAVKQAVGFKLVEPVFVGDKAEILKISKEIDFDISAFQIIDEPNIEKSARKAVEIVKNEKHSILMKGILSTSTLLKAVLDKENGIRTKSLLSHFALFETDFYPKLLGVTDAAMNVAPTFNEKVGIIDNSVEIFKHLGVDNPKVAIICPVETVNDKIESTVHAAMLTLMNQRGQIKGCIVDGPLALDNAVSEEAAHHKGIHSPVAGFADLLVAHNLDGANILYKALNFLGGAKCAAVIVGAKVPLVLTSRSDSDQSKMFSIALAACLE